MNLLTRLNSLQTFQLLLYRKALHPELFNLKARRSLKHADYELEAWVIPGGHVMRFQHNGFCASELVTDQDGGVPVDAAVTSFLCAGEHEFDHKFNAEGVHYMTSVQTETLSENLYAATYDEMQEFSKETGALLHRWNEVDGRRNMSMLDVQRLAKEVHAQSYHLMAHGGVVVRTQTIFEHR